MKPSAIIITAIVGLLPLLAILAWLGLRAKPRPFHPTPKKRQL